MATNESKEFTVALCGFEEADYKALCRAFKLSETRPRRYSTWLPNGAAPSICILNEDVQSGADDWMEIRLRLPGAKFPVVRVGAEERVADLFSGYTSIFFKRPVLANRVLKALDELVTEFYRFAPELAIRDDVSAEVVSQAGKAQLRASPTRAKRVLVVDDSESVRKMMELRLSRWGYTVEVAVSGEEGLTKARERSYDLIFLDVMLPGINGYNVSRALKHDIGVSAPVVMLTSKSSRIDRLRGSLASADAYLTKPLTIESLNETLERYLR